MKTSKLIAATTALLATAAIIFYGCKKTTALESKEQAELVETFVQKLKDQPKVSTEILNLSGKGFYTDLEGNKITPGKGGSATTNATSCPEPTESEFSQTLFSIDREYTCGTGYRFLVTYKIVSEFYPVVDISSTQFSNGRIKLLNSSGTQVYITPVANKNPLVGPPVNNGVVGHNSIGADLNEFLVTYRSEVISDYIYSQAATVQSNLIAYTDCSNYPILQIGFSSQQATFGSQHTTQPCLRVDKVYWNPRSGSTPPSLGGCDVLGSSCFPSGYVRPHKQEVQFKNASNVWVPFYLYIPGPSTNNSGLINYWDVWYIDVPGTPGLTPGNVQVRYRNNLMSTSSNGGPCVTQPADTWVYETWYLN
ncbi:hypothetical protein [Ferruginibacter sp.]